MRNAKSIDRTVRSVTINLRADTATRTLIDRAAEQLGKNRSAFMLEAARREATTVLLDQRFFALDEKAYTQFMAALDNPPTENRRVRRLLAGKAAWDK